MAEPRARMRQKGQYFGTADLADLLSGFGAQAPHLPSTITVLDEIIQDFIIEICHQAALSASYSRRQKIKFTDFQWTVRENERMLGRGNQAIHTQKDIAAKRKNIDVAALGQGANNKALANIVPEGEDFQSQNGKPKKRRKRKAESDIEGSSKKPHV